MKVLYDEVISRFPETADHMSEDDKDLPYLVMGAVAGWLVTLSPARIDSPLIKRIQDFQTWCENQPRTDDASTDILTIYTVAFYEDLFQHNATRLLIPHLMEKEDLVYNADYLKTWVGEDNYKLALANFGQRKWKKKKR